jgi:nucleotide-binding universal stress UspA family protein
VLIPLDGSPLAEAAIAEGMGLAAKFQADVVLARVLQWSTQAAIYGVPDVNIAAVDQDLIEVAETYMAKLAEPYQGAAKIDAVVLHGPPAESLITLVDERSIDLVVMTSHARGGLARVVLGSVADRLLQSKAPVLLVRPGLVD